jgi:hypothetical protein
MEKAKRVKAEVVGVRKKGAKTDQVKGKILNIILKLKLAIAIILDAIDFVLANIPILNTLWDFVTFIVLILILKNKWLAFGAFAELPLVGLPVLGQIDALIPIATLLTLIDSAETRFHIIERFE